MAHEHGKLLLQLVGEFMDARDTAQSGGHPRAGEPPHRSVEEIAGDYERVLLELLGEAP